MIEPRAAPPRTRMDSHGPCPAGIVLAGGGSMGAYEVGVLEALSTGRWHHGQGPVVDPSVYSGTSVGAYNAAFLVSRLQQSLAEAVQALRRIWLERIAAIPGRQANGIYYLRGTRPPNLRDPGALLARLGSLVPRVLSDSRRLALTWARLLLSSSPPLSQIDEELDEVFNLADWISTAPMASLIQETIAPQRLLERAACSLSLITTQWDVGQSAVFCNRRPPEHQDVIYAFRHIPLSTSNAAEAIRASAAIPGVFPAPRIGQSFFVDGGVLMNTPLLPAIQAGARTIHLITLQPTPAQLPANQVPTTLGALGRMWSYIPTEAVNEDLQLVQVIDEIRVLALELDRLQHLDPPSRISASQVPHLERFIQLFGQPCPVTVHRHFPTRPVGTVNSLLNFRQRHIQRLMQLGFQDAVQHDCRANGCLLPNDLASI